MRRPGSLAPALRALAACVLVAASAERGATGAQDAPLEPAIRCEVAGVVSGLRLRAVTPRRRALTLDGVHAIVAPIRHGLAAVRATLEDGTAVEGTTRHEVPFEVGVAATLVGGALVVRPGAAILDTVPVDGTATADVDVVVADGVVARGVTCPCAALRPVLPRGAVPAPPPSSAVDRAAPRWRPRVRDLHLRSGELPETGEDLHLDVTDATLVLLETERHRGWVRVAAALAGGDIAGWTRDTDLGPAPRGAPDR